MNRLTTRTRATTVTLIAVIALLIPATTQAATAQSGGRLDLVAQSTWMGELPAAIDLRISGAPADARLAVRLLKPVTTRDEVIDSTISPELDTDLLAFFEVTDLDAARVGSGEVVSVVMPDDEIGELIRRDPGALTVVIDLMSQDTMLDRLITHILVAPTTAIMGHDLGVAFVYDMRQPLALQPDLRAVVDTDSVIAATEFLDARPDTPIALRINAETIEAVAADTESAVGDTLPATLADREILLEPWVDLDEEGWRSAGVPEMVISQYALGRESTESQLSASPIGIVQVDPDTTPETISLLRSAGATGLLVSPDQIRPPASGRTHQPVGLLDDNGVAISAMPTDDSLLQTLSGTDPELSAQHAVVELAMDGENLNRSGATVIDITHLDPIALDVLVDGIAESPRLHLTTLEGALSLPVARNTSGSITRAQLVPQEPPDLTAAAADFTFTASTINSYSSMVPTNDAPTAPLRRLVEASVSSTLHPDGMSDYTSQVFDAIDQGTRGISVIEGDRVTLASHSADLPLLIRNEQTLPVTVDLLLRSEKLRFPDGEHRILTLSPGDNELTIKVEAPTSGDARVTTLLSSPDGRLELARGNVNVRSTAISGLGLIISIISLLILLSWWARTILRVRRTRSAASFNKLPDDNSREPGDHLEEQS